MTGRRSTLLPLWELLVSSEADTIATVPSGEPASGSEEGELCVLPVPSPKRTLIPRAEQRGKKARYEYVGAFIGDKNRYS